MKLDYCRDGEEIYRRSFATAKALLNQEKLSDNKPLPALIEAMALRLIHSVGHGEFIHDLVYHDDILSLPDKFNDIDVIYADCQMVKAGMTDKFLLNTQQVKVTLNDAGIAQHALKIGNTRSAAAVDFWQDMENSIIVIGNAPTALFRLLERIVNGEAKPPLAILAFPVGFIGAYESKQALVDYGKIPYVTILSSYGGSPMAASCFNALSAFVNNNGQGK